MLNFPKLFFVKQNKVFFLSKRAGFCASKLHHWQAVEKTKVQKDEQMAFHHICDTWMCNANLTEDFP